MKKYFLMGLFLLVSPFAHAAIEFDGTTEYNTEGTAFEFPSEPVKVNFANAGDYSNYFAFTLASTQDVMFDFALDGINGDEGILNITVVGFEDKKQTVGIGQGEASFTFADLAADTYLLQVDTKTKNNGFYTLSSSISPVPEPSTLALMMAGFGLVGFMSNRRRQFV